MNLLDEPQQVALAVRKPQLWPGGELEMDDRALQALVTVLQADHALHMGRCCLLRG